MSARDLALFELDAHALASWPAQTLRGRIPPAVNDDRDLALARQLHQGVVKNLLRLEHLIAHYATRPLNKIDPLVQKVLAIALYQMFFLDRVPQAAAVNQAVEQAKLYGMRSATGFVNAVLRRATRLAPPALPNAQDDPENYARLVLSHPAALFQKLSGLLGVSDALRFCAHSNRQPPLVLRLMGSTTLEHLQSQLPTGVSLVAHEQAGSVVVSGAKRALLADWADRQWAQVQDATATLPAVALGAQSGQCVLDRCCGRGTKTLQLHEAMQGQGRLIALDPHPGRCQTLRELVVRRKLSGIEVFQAGNLSDVPELAGVQFDRILVDVPCSNSGVLPRRPEARFAQSDEALASLALLQDQILHDAAAHLRPGGRLVYSTCSLWPRENQERIAQLLKMDPTLQLERDVLTYPSFDDPAPTHYRDGGYFASLSRNP
jgi:16S rRNA (cytosine967-C5)-methyltransferase